VRVHLTVNLATGTVIQNDQTERLRSFENVLSGQGDDVLRGDNGPNLLLGSGGDDRMIGAAGPDILFGVDGRDFGVGGGGRDRCSAEREKGCERGYP
jgi:Ca2+-binding RTX toxin-like protein